MRVLVVEDERNTREFIERALREAGYSVDAASNGRPGASSSTTSGTATGC